jgi:outer membrane protein assembly factor BamA
MKRLIIYLSSIFALCACSSISNLPEDEVLYTGMKKIMYTDKSKNDAFISTQAEIEAALACKPNSALLGSSSYRFPFPFRLWIYNSLVNTQSSLGKWILNSFGTEPVLMSNVNPAMRASIAENVLHYHGYFNGYVDYKEIPSRNHKKAKLSYKVTMGHLFTFDTIKYVNYPAIADSLINFTKTESLLKHGDPFSVSKIEAERVRLNNLFRNNGYFFFRSGYLTYVADTVSLPGRVLLNSQLITNIPSMAKKQWYLGKLRIEMRNKMTDELTDSSVHKFFSVYYKGKHVPLSPRVILHDLTFRKGELYNQKKYEESMENINASGLYSLTDFTFTPRDTTIACDTLDMTLNAIFDKPYDCSIEGNFNNKSNDRMGPGLVLALTKRNAFRGGEKLNIKLNGSYEWQTGKSVQGKSSIINSYEYGGSISIDYPRLELPWNKRYRLFSIPSTSFSISADCMNRADYFKMTTVAGAATYKFQTSARSKHEISPFMLDYEILQNKTARFDSIINANPALYVSMRNQFVPKMKYTYTYTSPSTYKNPIIWESSITESGNALSLFYLAAGKKFNAKEKDLFGNPFAQFLKLTTELRKTWCMGLKSQLIGRISGGVIFTYGNSSVAPYSEQFYVGGANSIRAFTVRSIGPGTYTTASSDYSYLDQTGDLKFEANLEYRFNIFGNLYGAAFLDAGNIWLLQNDNDKPGAKFKPQNFLKELATGTGIGIRYDMEFIVLRLDWGVALHVPYDTDKSGYYNISSFKDGQGLHFAIGYPF